MQPLHDKLGEPDLRIEGFQLWGVGWESEERPGYGPDNWLRAVAHCGGNGASVWIDGSFLETPDVETFAKECALLNESLTGRATLDSCEPNLRVSLRSEGRTGHLEVEVEITPDLATQEHLFRFTIDQSFLPEILRQCRRVLAAYPVRRRL